MSSLQQVLFYSLIGGVFSLIGGLVLLSRKRLADTLASNAAPFAAGALLAAAFFDLIPESMSVLEPEIAARWILTGILGFFLVEYFIHWFHHDHGQDHKHEKSAAPLIIIGDTIHNFIDGIAIGAAFLISPEAGIVTAVAVATHEIPQEIGDFGLLLKYGYSRTKTIAINVMSALAATIGAVTTFVIGSEANLPLGILLAITGGLFIYIAASDLIPAIHRESKTGVAKLTAVSLLLFGLIVVGSVTVYAHEYYNGHEHDRGSQREEFHTDHAIEKYETEHVHDEGEDHHHAEEH